MNNIGIVTENTLSRDFDDLFNGISIHFIQLYGDDPEVFAERFKMAVLSNLWSSPVFISTMVIAAALKNTLYDTNNPMIQSIPSWVRWIESTTGFDRVLKNTADNICTAFTSTVSQQITNRLNQTPLTFLTSPGNDGMLVTSTLLDNPMFNSIKLQLLQYIGDVLGAPNIRNVHKTIVDEWKKYYGWFHGITRDYKEVQEYIVADILVQRTYILDTYATVKNLTDSTSVKKLYKRYKKAQDDIGKTNRGEKLKSRHNLDYISFWDRLEYINTLIGTPTALKDKITPGITKEQMATHIFLLYLIPFIHEEWIQPLHDLIDVLDKLLITDKSEHDKRIQAVWNMVHGAIVITKQNPAVTVAKLNYMQYSLMYQIIAILSRWGWADWFCDDVVTQPQITPQKIGRNIKYIPVLDFQKIIQIYLNRKLNIGNNTNDFIRELETNLSSDNIHMDGQNIAEVLKERFDKPSKEDTMEFPVSSTLVSAGKTEISSINDVLYAIQYTLNACIDAIQRSAKLVLEGTEFESTSDLFVRTIGNIHVRGVKSLPNKNLLDISSKVTKAIRAIEILNNSLTFVKLRKPPRVYASRQDITTFELFASKVINGGYVVFYPDADANMIINTVRTRVNRFKTSESDAILDWSNVFAFLEVGLRLIKPLVGQFITQWTTFDQFLTQVSFGNRTKSQLISARMELNSLFLDCKAYILPAKIERYRTIRSSQNQTNEYETAFGTRIGGYINSLPYIVSYPRTQTSTTPLTSSTDIQTTTDSTGATILALEE